MKRADGSWLPKGLCRVDKKYGNSSQHGYNARISVRGQRYKQWFGDHKHGGAQEALKAATEWMQSKKSEVLADLKRKKRDV